jgi:hypothetical protein
MAERRRRDNKDRKVIHCEISLECWQKINDLAGDYGLGWALEQMCEREDMVRRLLESHLPREPRDAAIAAVLGAKYGNQ